MTRSLSQKLSLFAAVLLLAAPICFGLFRGSETGSDLHMLWMAVATTIFTVGVLASSIGRRHTRKAAYSQATVILVVSTLVAAGTAYMLGATAGPDVWMVAFVFGALLAVSSYLLWLSRTDTR